MNKLLRIGLLLVLTLHLFSCNNESKEQSEFPCDGLFYLKLEGQVEKELCAAYLENYSFTGNQMMFSVSSDELAGKVLFEMQVNAYQGPRQYTFGTDQPNKCKLVVKGASDEFYHCTSGSVSIESADKDQLIANFEIEIEGFYNKKTIHARGGVRL